MIKSLAKKKQSEECNKQFNIFFHHLKTYLGDILKANQADYAKEIYLKAMATETPKHSFIEAIYDKKSDGIWDDEKRALINQELGKFLPEKHTYDVKKIYKSFSPSSNLLESNYENDLVRSLIKKIKNLEILSFVTINQYDILLQAFRASLASDRPLEFFQELLTKSNHRTYFTEEFLDSFIFPIFMQIYSDLIDEGKMKVDVLSLQ